MPTRKRGSQDSYLDQLKFNPKLKNTLIAKYLTNIRYIFLLVISIVIIGVFSYINLPRRLNPEVELPLVSVTTVLPGAGPQDVERLITVPLEDKIRGIQGIDTLMSTSVDNLSQISVQFTQDKDPDKAKDEVKNAVDAVSDLPEDAQDPQVIKLDFENQPVWTFLITTKKDNASLIEFAKNLRDKIEDVPVVSQVTVSGIEEEEVQILIKSEAQQAYNLDYFALSQKIKAALPSYPAGSLSTDNSSFSITIDPSISTIDQLRQTQINISNQVVKLGDIAQISEKSKPNQPTAYIASTKSRSQKAVTFYVFKTSSANISKAVDDVRKVTDDENKRYKNNFEIKSILDLSGEIDKQFGDLTSSFINTIALVFITLFIFLGIRQAVIVSFCIPLSFLVSFTIMRITGLTLNFLSLFSLILALGLLVDDAIVVVTAVTHYWHSKKFTPNETGLLVLRDFFVPIWSTTITAVWAFLPLLLTSGIIGEFIKSIPIIVTTTLIASTAIAILITLPLMMASLKPNPALRVRVFFRIFITLAVLASIGLLLRNNPLFPLVVLLTLILFTITYRIRKKLVKKIRYQIDKKYNSHQIESFIRRVTDHGFIDSQKLARKYHALIMRVLSSKSARIKVLVAVIIFALVSYLLVPLGFVVNEFFPKTDEDILYINVKLPAGTSVEKTNTEAIKLLAQIRETENTEFTVAETSKSISTTDFFGGSSQSNLILYTLHLEEDRNKTSSEIAQDLRSKFASYTAGELSVVELSGGPPAGADIQLTLIGEDFLTLDNLATQIVANLKTQPGVTNVQKSIESETSRLVFVPDRQELAANGLTEDTLSREIRNYTSGFTLEDVKIGDKTKDITFRSTTNDKSPEEIAKVTIKTPQGTDVQLGALGFFKLEPNPTLITREDGKRTLTVSAAITKGYSISKTNKELTDFAATLNLPYGYSTKTGGVNEENQQSVNSIFQAMALAFVLILATMVLQFGSFRQAFVTIAAIPLAASGVFYVFALTGTPLSFPTLIGILALFGIVVYQAMILVDKINRNQKIGMNLKSAIADAGASRVEPILFGTITTVMGLLPITMSDPLWRGLGGAIIAGLLFSGAIKLLFIPVVYYMIYQDKTVDRKKRV